MVTDTGGSGDRLGSAMGGWRHFAPVALTALAALAVGLPTLGGGFVGGDDHRLLLNHVLINHPSIEHALKLFTIYHRDLYQPIPLLTFSAEFALARSLGLFDSSATGGAWLFHLTNVLLHAVNTVLVWAVVRMLHERAGAARSDWARSAPVVAALTALMFAVHPLQTEVIAWTNGRMMLLSTLFGLLSLLTFASWLDTCRTRALVLTLAFVLLSALSKVRIGLPVLLVIVVRSRRVAFSRRVLTLWLTAVGLTGVFAVVNFLSTSKAELFSEAAEHLRGPHTVRVLLALAWYFQHLVWPVGLASYYPTPPIVHWSDPGTWKAIAVVAVSAVLVAGACWRSRVARLGVLWFMATIAVTLPFVPARNVLAADRYMYLPIIGLLWVAAVFVFMGSQRWAAGARRRVRQAAIAVLGGIVLSACIGMCWHVGSFYATPLRKTLRIAQLFPDTPRVWERLGWSYYSEGRYRRAIECARKELRHDVPAVRSGAYQLLGMAELRLGHEEAGLQLLHRAIEVDPKNGLAQYRLAMAYDDRGRVAEAAAFYEAAVQLAPLHNPTINRLAETYRRLGRLADARKMYERAVENNRYEVTAIMQLAELDIQKDTRASYLAAESRLETLLSWMPENTAARTNLGVVMQALGRTAEAIEAYETVLSRDPDAVTAALNLAQLYLVAGQTDRARPLFERASAELPVSVAQAKVIHDFFASQGDVTRCVGLWARLAQRLPDVPEVREFAAWSLALAGNFDHARAQALAPVQEDKRDPLPLATLALVDLAGGRYESAMERTDALARSAEAGADARRRLLGALERFDQAHPNVGWTFCLAARLLMADGNLKGARVFVGLCEQRCPDASCRTFAKSLKARLADTGLK